jgi:phospholipid/cholesterol/gamma-HCH transport system permease protein
LGRRRLTAAFAQAFHEIQQQGERASMAFLQDTGRMVSESVVGAGYTLKLLLRSLGQSHAIVHRFREVLDQMFYTGVRTLPVVLVVATFAGMILALQTGIELRRIGQANMIGVIVAQAMCREMGPFITGTIIAATVGSKMAAELGTMNVSEEITALEVMSIDPVRFLVMPRTLALSVMCPVLTLLSDVIGILGGGIVAEMHLGVGYTFFVNRAIESLTELDGGIPKDVYVGLFKAWVFGLTIATIGCAAGLRAQNGALGVGRAVQQAVKNSVLLIIIQGYIITWLFYYLLG